MLVFVRPAWVARDAGEMGSMGWTMDKPIFRLDERRHMRWVVKSPLSFEIGGISLTGLTVNTSREGIMAKCSVSLENAFEVLKFLDKEQAYRTVLEFNLDRGTYIAEAEVRHYHLDYSSDGSYLLRVGFVLPEEARKLRKKS